MEKWENGGRERERELLFSRRESDVNEAHGWYLCSALIEREVKKEERREMKERRERK